LISFDSQLLIAVPEMAVVGAQLFSEAVASGFLEVFYLL
jgi:hypothetical protein